MPDDPKKRGRQDRARVSKQPHERAYQRKKARVASTGASGGTKRPTRRSVAR